MIASRYPTFFTFGAITIFARNINIARRAEEIILAGHSSTDATQGVVWVDGKPVKWRIFPLGCQGEDKALQSRPYRSDD